MATTPEPDAENKTGASAPGAAPLPGGRVPSEQTRPSVPVSERDGVHPQLAVTAMGDDEGDLAPPPVEVDAWIGRILSNVYRVEQKIGEGGMGAVYMAKHIHLQKAYAVKVLTSHIANNAQAVERLKQEAIAASSIEHDNIVDVTNFDRAEDGSVFIVMELLRGESLADRVNRGPMPIADALPIAWQICAALGAAHARGIVHRDLKPENIFLSKRGTSERVKVLDFGISKIKSAEADGVRMTRTGQLVGTPLYMSPEQARGEQDIDKRVDIYALGVILYEMLAGAPPFDGRNYFELLWKHGNEPPVSLRDRNPPVAVSAEIEAVVMRALAKNKDERFQTMEDLSHALEMAAPEVQRGSGGSLTSLPPEGRRESTGRVLTGRGSPGGAATLDAAGPKAPITESIPMPPPAGRGPVFAGLAVVALLVVGGGAWAFSGPGSGSSHPDPTPPIPTGSVGPIPDPPPEVPEIPEGVVPPEPVLSTVGFTARPEAVEVRTAEGAVLCTTPCFYDLPADAPAVVTFHREGYLDETRTVIPVQSPTVEVRLRPRRRTPEDDGSGPHLKTKI